MIKSPNPWKQPARVLMALAVLLCGISGARAQATKTDVHKAVRLTVVITGGDEKKPVDSASVYVKYDKVEMNLKTNLSGVCHAPEIPPGRILIQVIAPGWKTFGQYYDADQAEQTINIGL